MSDSSIFNSSLKPGERYCTFLDVLPVYNGKALVIMLGDCEIGEGLEVSRLLRFPDAGQETVNAIGNMDVRELSRGVFVVVSSEVAEKQFKMVWLIQKYLVHAFCKYIWFPMQNTSTPDPYGIGGDKGPLASLVYEINKLDNLPALTRHPRADSLLEGVPQAPVLLLSPGASLEAIGPHLKELSERFLVISLARSLPFCARHGVMPDIVVQLDTHGEQQNFFPEDMDLSNTWLFALSCIPGRKYLNRFRGVFWIDAFEPQAYGSHYEIRNSWLSSLIPMLGVAELFSAPKLLMAGVDLAYGSARYYDEQGQDADNPEALSNADRVKAVSWRNFEVLRNDGTVGETTPQFFAVLFEAETVASELLHKGTLPFNLSRAGLLDEDVFPHAAPEAFLDEPPLKKEALFRVMELRSKVGVLPQEKIIKAILHERQRQAAPLLRDLEGLAATTDAAELVDHPLVSAGKLINRLHPTDDPEALVHLAKKLIQRYQGALQERAMYYRLKDWAAMEKVVPVYCLAGEKVKLEGMLATVFPSGRWEFRTTWGSGHDEGATPFKIAQLPTALSRAPVSLISRAYAEGADYLLPYIKADKYLIVEDVAEAGWPDA